ncbi:MAG TPA: transcriptional regulator GcvA [Stellaceae bacterium]|jgi:LysR family transcriptional regulator, glycine cleavage system transcriptional activator|nr:transcriptional regulator GcvA [Stellaceae bacterium]
MNDNLPPLSALRAFEAAARHMSFSKAAEELFVTPAAISHQIHTLEQDLGVRLFHRLNRSIELSASGRVLLPGLVEAFAEIRASVRRLRAHNDTGSLTMTASPSFAAKWLVLRLHRFQERCAEIDVRISATDEVVDLTKGDFDIAIRYGSGHYPGLDVELLFTNEVFPACGPQLLAKGPPLRTPDDLRHHALIHDQAIERDPLVPTWPMWLKAAGVKDVPPTAGLSFNNMSLALDAAIAGHGVVLAYSTIAAADIAAGRLVRLFSLALPDQFAYYIVTALGALERPKVRAFRDWLREEADRQPQSLAAAVAD